jgi:hypothetical protein
MKVTRKAGKIDALRQTIKGLDGAESKVGWFPSAVYEKGQPVAGIAAVQEFGSPSRGIPPRPFFRTTAIEKRGEWSKNAEQLARRAATGKMAPELVMEGVALAAGGNVRATITKIQSPPLKQSTIDARKRRLADGGASAKATIAKPLVDTGIMLATLSYEYQGKITKVQE